MFEDSLSPRDAAELLPLLLLLDDDVMVQLFVFMLGTVDANVLLACEHRAGLRPRARAAARGPPTRPWSTRAGRKAPAALVSGAKRLRN